MKIWDWRRGKLIRELPALAEGIAFSHDGRRIATAPLTGPARTGRAQRPRPRTAYGHTGAVYDVAFAPDDSIVATACAARASRLWDPRTGRQDVVLRGHEGPAWDVDFSPDGSKLAPRPAPRGSCACGRSRARRPDRNRQAQRHPRPHRRRVPAVPATAAAAAEAVPSAAAGRIGRRRLEDLSRSALRRTRTGASRGRDAGRRPEVDVGDPLAARLVVPLGVEQVGDMNGSAVAFHDVALRVLDHERLAGPDIARNSKIEPSTRVAFTSLKVAFPRITNQLPSRRSSTSRGTRHGSAPGTHPRPRSCPRGG